MSQEVRHSAYFLPTTLSSAVDPEEMHGPCLATSATIMHIVLKIAPRYGRRASGYLGRVCPFVDRRFAKLRTEGSKIQQRFPTIYLFICLAQALASYSKQDTIKEKKLALRSTATDSIYIHSKQASSG